jgi:hypothetical protein
MLSSLDVEVSSLLGCDPMSLCEYIRMFRWITVPSSSVFFFGCLTLKNLSNAGKYLTNNTASHARRDGATRLSTSPLHPLDVFVLERKNWPDVRSLSWATAVIMLWVS